MPDIYLDVEGHSTHPIESTIDAIAREWQKGWYWIKQYQGLHMKWTAFGPFSEKGGGGQLAVVVDDSGDEKLDRARLTCLCIIISETTKES